MRARTTVWWILLLLLVCVPRESAGAGVQRYALVTGANLGDEGRPELKYAVSDAEGFARVLTSLGGVAAGDLILLRQPTVGELEGALEELRLRVESALSQSSASDPVRTEVLVYYSGHADDRGLLLGDDRFSYRSLRGRLEQIPADVRLTVLDACASGAITRLKGGTKRQPFLVDVSSDMRGYAFLTSASADEAAQESDSLGASFFTHYLISGLRGAADVNGEGTVTLNEAYQFAFAETLGVTAETRAGAQHPSYDINLSGTGDVVITDLRETSASLVLAEALGGRCFVRNADGQLVVELAKPRGRRVELGLEPGRYEIRCQEEKDAFLSTPTLAEDQQVVLAPLDFTPTDTRETTLRGGYVYRAPVGVLNGRHLFAVRFGYRSKSGSTVSSGTAGVSYRVAADNIMGAASYGYWIRPDLAVGLTISSVNATVESTIGYSDVSSVQSLLVNVRRDFLRPNGDPRVRPYLIVGVGPYLGSGTTQRFTASGITNEVGSVAAVGGQIGGGVDFQLNRLLMFGASLGYNFMSDFSRPIGGRENYSGLEAGVNIGFLFGKGSRPGRF